MVITVECYAISVSDAFLNQNQILNMLFGSVIQDLSFVFVSHKSRPFRNCPRVLHLRSEYSVILELSSNTVSNTARSFRYCLRELHFRSEYSVILELSSTTVSNTSRSFPNTSGLRLLRSENEYSVFQG